MLHARVLQAWVLLASASHCWHWLALQQAMAHRLAPQPARAPHYSVQRPGLQASPAEDAVVLAWAQTQQARQGRPAPQLQLQHGCVVSIALAYK